ncbi:MAG: hypothetical protein DIU71_12255 [Proteobacteria bacterium]|nr:MAG: hypothetical protein DIU71_12255 [Pseudomonadota bacterium]
MFRDGRFETKTMSTGWGRVTASIDKFRIEGQVVTLLRLPHLSKHKLFSRAACAPHLDAILEEVCAHL